MLSFTSARAPPDNTDTVHVHRVATKIEGRLVGASLLCFCMDPTHSCIYFLLGKERHNARWPAGSGRWSDFGGAVVEEDDDSPEVTAAREFMEETLSVVKYFEHDVLPRTTYMDIAQDLRNNNHTMRVTQGDKHRRFVMFVKQIPWDPEVVHRFSEYRNVLTRPSRVGPPTVNTENHPAIDASKCVKRTFLEKKMLSLWSVPQLRHAVDYKGVMIARNGYAEHCRDSFRESLKIVLDELGFIIPGILEE